MHLNDSQLTSTVAVRRVYGSMRLMTFTLATENTRKCYQAPFPIFRTGPGNEASRRQERSGHKGSSLSGGTTYLFCHLVLNIPLDPSQHEGLEDHV